MNMRIIPRLDIKGPNLVKGINLEGLRVMGKPEDFARYYCENGADELLYIDVVASLYQRNSLKVVIESTKTNIYIPLAVGGGLRSMDDIKDVLRAGADKVVLNTAAINRPLLIKEASRRFGSSTIVISIEAKKGEDGKYECYTDNGRVKTGKDATHWARTVSELGAGEIIVTSIDKEGTGMGFDCELTRKISDAVSIPVIACGGAGNMEHFQDVIKTGRADAVSAASVFHYDCIKSRGVVEGRENIREGNINFLKSGAGYTKVNGISIPALKRYFLSCGINCR
jgi:cyclase